MSRYVVGVVSVGEGSDGHAAIEQVARDRPEVIVLELAMLELHVLEVISRVRAACPEARVILLSMQSASDVLRSGVRSAARSYVVEGSGLDELLRVSRALAGRDTVAADSIGLVDRPRHPLGPANDIGRLTRREQEVLQLIAGGRTNKEVGTHLGVSTKTVDVHRSNLMKKLNLHNAQDLTRLAMRRGLVAAE
jgi:DNA-binding NarL/FixJ family response regulator